jgi:hypothetical protein
VLDGFPFPPRWGGFDVSAVSDVFAEPDPTTDAKCLLQFLCHGGVVGWFSRFIDDFDF